jgi:predicted amidohydrolase
LSISQGLSIAVVQMEVVPGAVERNRRRALELAGEALREQPDVILFPEEMLVGYAPNLRELAEAQDGPTTQSFRRMLAGTETHVLWGLTERQGERWYIAATLVNAHGVVANYRKTHLWWAADGLRHEPAFYAPGNELVTFDLRGHRCGVMICYDGDFPEMTRSYANLGCRVLFWLNNRESRGHAEVRPLAVGNSMIIASACCCGDNEEGRHCGGGSNITDHDGALLAELWDREGIVHAIVNPEQVPEARQRNPWYHGRRPELYVHEPCEE